MYLANLKSEKATLEESLKEKDEQLASAKAAQEKAQGELAAASEARDKSSGEERAANDALKARVAELESGLADADKATEEAQVALKSVEDAKAKIADYEKIGIIRGYQAIIDEDKLDLGRVTAVIEVKVTPEREGGFNRRRGRSYGGAVRCV